MSTKRYFNVQPFNKATGELQPLQLHTIGYRFDRRTGNYILVYVNPAFDPANRKARQEIVVQSLFLRRVVPAVKSDAIAGCTEITPAQFAELGFITHAPKGGESNAVTA